MTANQRHIIQKLLQENHYLVSQCARSGVVKFKMYEGNNNPVQWVDQRTIKRIKNFLKKDKKGRFTLNLALMRQAHGNSIVNRLYKKKRQA